MSIHQTQGFVLRRYDVRETSLIINFFTLDFGKITGILKGIRTDPRKFGSTAEIFSLNDIVFYKKLNTQVHLVSQCDLKEHYLNIRQDISKIGFASMAMEIISSVMGEEDKNEEAFRLVSNTLSELASTDNPDKIMTIFKIKMLSLSGFKPHLDSCVACSSRIFNQAKFSLSLGGLVCEKCHLKDPGARTVFRGTIATILHIEKHDFKSNLTLGINPQIKKELDLVLNSFLNFHLEKELKTQKTLDKMDYFAPVV